MHKRTAAVLLGAFAALLLGTTGCSFSEFAARQLAATVTPTRTPRPTWTPASGGLLVASPTLDATRFPGLQTSPGEQPTPQVFIEGSGSTIFVPVPQGGGPAIQTVVVIIVTATPEPPATQTPDPFQPPPPATFTPGPPTPTPTVTPTPLPPVEIEVITDNANVRQGPGRAYPAVARLAKGTTVTVVGRDRDGEWWKICCVNGIDVWISADVTSAAGPIWTVAEVQNFPPPPPTPIPPPTPLPTPTYAWPFRLEGAPQDFPLGQDYFRVDAVIYDGATPLYGYKLRIRNLDTGQEWFSAGSETAWNWIVTEWPNDGLPLNPNIDCPAPRKGLRCIKTNVKWDSNSVQIPRGNAVWEVTATDGGGSPLSQPVRFPGAAATAKAHYVVFTSRP
jgi:hypothetical protein